YGAKLEPKQIKIKCGKKPSNAVVNCKLQACVFNIKSDPCEYNNIADKEVEMKNYLVQRVLWHNKTAIAPNNKPRDPKANPLYHNDTWDLQETARLKQLDRIFWEELIKYKYEAFKDPLVRRQFKKLSILGSATLGDKAQR
ncbi:arylsulfatase B-like protein, partial [Dinothrombium tinctorium]